MGCVSQVGEQALNIGRNALLAAGFPDTVPGTTVDRQCGSSQQALHFAAQGVIAGAYDVVVAAGVESMSRVPMGSSVLGADPFGVADGRALPRPRAPGHLGGADRRAVEAVARGARRVRSALAVARGAGDRRGALRPRDRAGRDDDRRRGDPARHHRGAARRAQARVPVRRRGHRGELVADQRRRRGGARDQRGGRGAPGPRAACPRARLRARRLPTRS